MQKRKSFFNNELEQRFSLRKYTIGLCSVCLGFVAIGIGSQTVKADTVNDAEKSSAVQENKAQDTNLANTGALAESKPNTSDSAKAKPNITPTETKEGEAGSVDTTAPKTVDSSNSAAVNTLDQSKSENSGAVAPTSEKTQLQTSQDSSIKAKENSLNNKSNAMKAVFKLTNLNKENNSSDPNSREAEVKPKESSNVDTNEQKEKDVTLVINSLASETNARSKPVQTVSPEQSADTTDVQPASDQVESAAANSNAPENDVSAASASTVLSKQPANADTQPTATTSEVQPFVNLAVESDNNDLTPKHETVTSQWTIHYVNSADHQQELKAPTVITMQYTRTNTPQSNGTVQYGDWSYVSGSFKQTGTPIAVNGSDNPTKEDNVDKDGKNYDVFSIVVQHPDITGYELHNGTNGVRLSDHLLNDESNGEIQAPTMSKDGYVEYDVAKERSVTVKFIDDEDFNRQVGQAITLTGHDGDTVSLNLTVPESDKYQLVAGQQLPTTYTFTAGSGDVTIRLAHKVVQREAAIDVQLALETGVNIGGDYEPMTITQAQWDRVKDDYKDFNGLLPLLPLVNAGTLTGHVDYDLVDNKVVSFGDDWTTLNLGGKTYQLPNGTDVVNGVFIDSEDTMGKPLKEFYLKDVSNIYPDYHVDPDYVNRPWYGYLSANATNNSQDNGLGLQAGLAGNEPNALAKAIGDRAATAVEMANKTIDLSLLNRFDGIDNFSEQNGRLQNEMGLPVGGVYIPYVEKTATRTINVTMPDGKTTTVKQTATLEKQVDLRPDAHSDWTTDEWTSYDVPTIPGYTASQLNVAKETVTGATNDQTVNITYTANPQTTTVVYQSEDGTSVHTTTVNGKTGQTVKVSNEVPVGWHVVNGNVPSEITFGPNGAPKTVVTIVHSHATVTSDAPKTTSDKLPDNPDKSYPSGVSENDLSKTVTRTIKVTTPDGQTKTVAQTAKLTRIADVDELTGEVKYGDWTTGNWSVYTAPSVPGYTASQSSVTQQAVTDTTRDQTVNITYTANDHQISVEYVDNSTGQVLKTDHVSGKTGQTVPITLHVPDGWELVSGQSVPSEVTLGADGAPATVIKVQPQERSVAVKFVDDQSFDWYGTDYKKQVGQAVTLTGRDGETVDLHLTVPDKYQLADGQQLPTTYTFTAGSGDVTIHLAHKVVQREAAVDVKLALVTIVPFGDNGDDHSVVTQAQWNQLDDELKSHVPGPQDILYPLVKVGTLTGHVGYDLVNGHVVSFGDDWTTLNLGGRTYQLPNGTEIVNGVVAGYVESFGKKLKSVILADDPDVDPDYVNRPWHGYLSVNATNNSDDFVANASRRTGLQAGLVGNEPNALTKATGDRAATGVEMSDKTIDLGWLQDIFRITDNFSEQDGQLRTKVVLAAFGVYIPYVEKTATRTINVMTPDGKTTMVKQTATLAKQVDFSDDAHPDWTTGEWASYDAPTIPGYTASQSNVAKEAVTGTTKDQTVNITYTANDGTQTIVYQDEDGSEIGKQVISGKTDEKVKVTSDVPDGYVLKGEVPSEVTIKPDDTPITVTVEHGKSHVTPDKPVNKGDLIPDTKDKHYPEGLTHNDLNKTVTREITIIDPTGKKSTTAQTVTFTRGATVDEVTNKVTYDDWSENGKHTFDKVDVPTVPGYTVSGEVPEVVVTPETQSSKVDITYTANAQTATITYIDDTEKKSLGSDKQNGKFNQVITFEHDPAEVIKGLEEKGYKLVSNDFNSNKYQADNSNNVFYVHLKHGTSESSRKDDVNMTVHYVMDDGSKAPSDSKQTVSFTESGIKDNVTGNITWMPVASQTLKDVDSPVLTGYTADIKTANGKVVNFGDPDINVTVHYSANAQTATITYIDDTEKKSLGSDKQNGKFNQVITFEHDPAEVIKGLEEKGYKLVSDNFKSGVKYQNDNKSNSFEVHLVHSYEPVETSQTITETVHYIDANGKPVAPDHVATVVVKVTGTRDKVTDSITWNTPSTGHFDKVISPKLPNMIPDKKLIPGRDVQYGDSDITESVVYTPDEIPSEPEEPNKPDNSTSKTPEKPNKPDNSTSKTPEKPNKPSNLASKTSEKSNKPSNLASKTSEKSNKSSKEVSKQFGTIAKTTIPEKLIDSRTVDNHVSAKSTAKQELPQTGATTNTGIWTGLVSMIAGLGLVGASKKRKKN